MPLNENSKFGLSLTSLAVVIIFVFSTAISVGWALADQARANISIMELQTEVKDINDERKFNREKYLETLNQINARLTRIETKLDQR